MDDIKARVDIVDLVGEGVTLRKSGRTFKAPCPFHAEKTPSFVVDPQRQSWHCFGACAEGGDIFSWVMRRQQVDFREALRVLADRAGVQLEAPTRASSEREERRRRLASLNDAASAFYQRQLAENPEAAPARNYVEERGIDAATSQAFGLGYAGEEPDALLTYLTARGNKQAEVVAAGLAMENDRGAVDRFRGRLLFPIRDARGRSVGFGGRTLNDDGPKYLNTAQTEIFDKSRLLYGLDRARDAIRESDRIVIVEGYMDVIAAHQHGQLNTVASMGTALTEEQVQLIKPLTRNVVLALDADAAGAAATLRGIEVGREAMGHESIPIPDARGLVRLQDTLAADIRIAELPAGRDPDDLVRADPELWSALLAQAPTFMDYRFTVAVAARDLENARERASLVEELMPLVTAIAEPVVRAEYLQRLARLARLETVALQEQLRHRRTSARGGYAAARTAQAEAVLPRDRQSDFLLQLLAARPDLVPGVEQEARRWIGGGLAQELLAAIGRPEEEVAEPLQQELVALRERARALMPFSDDEAERAAHQAVERLRTRRLREQMRPQTEAIADHERAHTSADLAALAAGAGGELPIDPEFASAVRSLIENMETGRELHLHRPPETPLESRPDPLKADSAESPVQHEQPAQSKPKEA